MSMRSVDEVFMEQALKLAEKGRFTTPPNPNVGCVLVKNGTVVGEGFHYRQGEAHAEVNALNMAKEQAKGATAYVTLEPCNHFGKTPPCVDALIRAGVSRVVTAMEDPNPLVAGQGLKRLAQAGIDVISGVLHEQAETINKGFLTRMRLGRPYVQLKLASSLDGRTAMASGESQWITGEAARQDVQVYRAQSHAILTTSQTVIDDDPAMTVRWQQLPLDIQQHYPESQLRQPIRIVIDSQGRVNENAKLFYEPGETWLFHAEHSELKNKVNLANVRHEISSQTAEGEIDLASLFVQLGKEQINQLWVEAGAKLAGGLISQQLVDELIVYMAPKLLGHQARALCDLPHVISLSQAPEFIITDCQSIGADIRLTLIPK